MDKFDEHKLRIEYLDVLLKNGVSLENATLYINNILGDIADIQITVENDEVVIPPKQKTLDFTNTTANDIKLETPVDPAKENDVFPKMVNPNQNILESEKGKPVGGVRESSAEQMGLHNEIPLRYEDRIKQAQR